MAKDKDYIKLIHSSQWVKLRAEKLRNNPLCERCLEADGIITVATEVHHVRPVEESVTMADKERLMFNYFNLMAVCHRCHVEIHTEMGRSGKMANKERNSRKLDNFVQKFFVD